MQGSDSDAENLQFIPLSCIAADYPIEVAWLDKVKDAFYTDLRSNAAILEPDYP
ncbi:MAG: hypothetical protein LBU32_19680 [Clostridiales bacterium]|jgi:hypothetical protein|nr:hypothetical protein [Clostridiales bacterium]